MTPMGGVFSSVHVILFGICNSSVLVLQWWGFIWIGLGALLSGMVVGTFFCFLTSLASRGAMGKLGSSSV